MADKIAPGVTAEGPSRGAGPPRNPENPFTRDQRDSLRKARERSQTALFFGIALYFIVTWLAPLYFPEYATAGLVASGLIVASALAGIITFAARLGRLEAADARAAGPEALAEHYKEKRDGARWYAVVGVMMLFVAGFSPAIGAGGVLMVLYGIVAYLVWNRKAKQTYDPWQDDELDDWEEEQFGRL